MADRYLLESGAPDGYLLEDGTGVLLLQDVSVLHLTTNSNDVDATSFTTASITPTADRLVLAAIWSGATGVNSTPTVTGNSLTWELVDQAAYDVTGTFGILHLFRAMGSSPTSGVVTIDFGATTQLACGWSISEWGGVDTSGSNGSGAIVQSVDAIGLGASADVTLAAFSDTDNPTYGALAQQTADVETLGANYIRLGRSTTAVPVTSITSFYDLNNDTSVDADWVTATEKWGIIGVEIKAATAGAVNANAGNAAGTGAALGAASAIAVNAALASATGAALAATVQTGKAATAGLASATASASDIDAAVATGAAIAAATGSAANATVSTATATNAPAGLVSSTGAAGDIDAGIAPRAGFASATGSSANAATAVAVLPGGIAATGTAYNATATATGGNINAFAGLASATGQAYGASTQTLAGGRGGRVGPSYLGRLPDPDEALDDDEAIAVLI